MSASRSRSASGRAYAPLIEAIPEEDWTPIPYWLDDGADVAETTYTPFQHMGGRQRGAAHRAAREADAGLTAGALRADYSYHAFITDRAGEMMELEADHRRHAEIENAIRDLKYGVGLNHLPSGRFAANAAWLAVQVIAHNLARWTARLGLARRNRDDEDAQAALLCPRRTAHTLRPALDPAPPEALALG